LRERGGKKRGFAKRIGAWAISDFALPICLGKPSGMVGAKREGEKRKKDCQFQEKEEPDGEQSGAFSKTMILSKERKSGRGGKTHV